MRSRLLRRLAPIRSMLVRCREPIQPGSASAFTPSSVAHMPLSFVRRRTKPKILQYKRMGLDRFSELDGSQLCAVGHRPRCSAVAVVGCRHRGLSPSLIVNLFVHCSRSTVMVGHFTVVGAILGARGSSRNCENG
jgi:hypothetical protein